MATATRLILTQEVWERVLRHVRAVVPQEAVGILAGASDGRATYAASLPNLAPRGSFLADPRAQFDAERGCRRLGLIPLAGYHSHPDGTPTLSLLDRVFAHPSLLQLVIAVSDDGAVAARAYRTVAGSCEVPLAIDNTSHPSEA